MLIEVRACDIDRKTPAQNYTITASDGRSISKDLCEEHAEPFEEWLEEAGLDEEEAEPEPEPAKEEESAPVVPKRPAPKRAPAKKTTARRRPKIVSLEEIEAQKKG
ncbi:hypothetical protein PV708_02805 [Streptomyces sp. ME02-6977A]|uniref:hypothetical protein n=1 Tax=Streptomyces sp. ME02-6977A TaxID=3028671 RepID=UPI0029A31098|nr:hypothetical protein [Streptomyces sp. ME02-6977A]MDX3405167.1 hypothetical protein [Streptomyces sp. ME02-6977A]